MWRKWIYKISMSIWWNRKGKLSQIVCSDFVIPKFVATFKNQCVLCSSFRSFSFYFLLLLCVLKHEKHPTNQLKRGVQVEFSRMWMWKKQTSFRGFFKLLSLFFQLQDAADFNWHQQHTHFLGVVIDSITYIWILSFKYRTRKHNMMLMLVASDLRKRKW